MRTSGSTFKSSIKGSGSQAGSKHTTFRDSQNSSSHQWGGEDDDAMRSKKEERARRMKTYDTMSFDAKLAAALQAEEDDPNRVTYWQGMGIWFRKERGWTFAVCVLIQRVSGGRLFVGPEMWAKWGCNCFGGFLWPATSNERPLS
jgi:hypothetical protein